MLIDAKSKQKATSLANLSEVAAEAWRVVEARITWNEAHPDSTSLDVASWWNRATMATRIVTRVFTGERLSMADADFLDLILHSEGPAK